MFCLSARSKQDAGFVSGRLEEHRIGVVFVILRIIIFAEILKYLS